MPRNWQYGRLRVVVLQVVMWLVFGASLALAAYLDHRRSAAFDLRLGEPRTLGRLIVRLPAGWEVAEEAGPPQALVAKDFDRQGRHQRTLRVTVRQQTGRVSGPEYYLENVVSLPGVEEDPQFEPFPMLGQGDGALIAFKIQATRRMRRMMPNLPEAGVYACVVMPDGLTVTLQLTGDGAYGPSSRRALRTVADSMRLADSPSANPVRQ